MAFIAAADVTDNYGVAVLLESCLADKLAVVERTRHLIRNLVEVKIAERRGAERAALAKAHRYPYLDAPVCNKCGSVRLTLDVEMTPWVQRIIR